MKTPERILLAIIIAGSSITSVLAQSTLPKAQHDSLWAVWSDPAQADTNRLKALYDISWDGYLNSQPDSAYFYAQLQYDLAAARGLKIQMADALSIQGVSFSNRGDHLKALDHHQRSLSMREEVGDKKGIAKSLNSIGIIYSDQGDHPKALDHHQRSLKIQEEFGNKMGIAISLNNIGNIYFDQGDHHNALDHHQRSLKIREELGDRWGISASLNNIGNAYAGQGDDTRALDQYERSLKIKEEIGDKMGVALLLYNIGIVHTTLRDLPMALDQYQRSLKISEEMGDKSGVAYSSTALGQLHNQQWNYQQAKAWCGKSLKLTEEMEAIGQQKHACQCLYDAYKGLGRHREALVYLEKMNALDKLLNKEETTRQLERMEFQKLMLQDSIAKAEQAWLMQEAHKEEVRKRDRTRNILIGAGSLFVLLAAGFYSRERHVRRSRDLISKERDRSENLLLNILPGEIAAELKDKGHVDARDIDKVSILFTDFKDFTEQSATMSAAALVNEINHCFEAFDGIMVKYGIEKIKTIGDAYMAAGGLPIPTEDSVKNTVLAALEMQRFIRERKAQNESLGEPAFEMRVGIHTGPVVAGIVGVKKFQYDIWGDTVNTASRMESNGVAGQVNISEATYQLVKDQFQCTSRGEIEVKGKGAVRMYFVERLKDERAVEATDTQPASIPA